MNNRTVLITNDDGIDAAGIRILAREVKAMGARVVVVAPDREQSAASHAISFRSPLRMHEIQPDFFAVSGTPADCTYMGLFEVLKVPPDLVISGINDGYNLGTDVFYSGTFAGAFEGALRGLPALALSTNRGAPEEILVAVSRAAITVAIRMLEIPLAAGTVLNMNHPDVLVPQGIRMTSLGKRVYLDDVEKRLDPRGVPYYWIGGSPSFGFDNLVGGERGALIENFISLTPVNQVNISHPEEYAHFENLNGKVAR